MLLSLLHYVMMASLTMNSDFVLSASGTLFLSDGVLYASGSPGPLTCRQLAGYEVEGDYFSGYFPAPDAVVAASADNCPASTLSYRAFSGTLPGLLSVNNPLRFDSNKDCRISKEEFSATLASVSKELGTLDDVLWSMLRGGRDYSIDDLRKGFDGLLQINQATTAGSGDICNDDGTSVTSGTPVHHIPTGTYIATVRTPSLAPFSFEAMGAGCNLWFGLISPRRSASSGLGFHNVLRVKTAKPVFGLAQAPLTVRASTDPVADLIAGGDGIYVTDSDTVAQLSTVRCSAIRELPVQHPAAADGNMQRGPDVFGARCKARGQEMMLQLPGEWQLEESFSPTMQVFTAAADRDRTVQASKLFSRSTLERQLHVFSVPLPGFVFERGDYETDSCLVFLMETACTLQCFSHCLEVLQDSMEDGPSPPVEYFGDLFELGNFSAKFVKVSSKEQKPEKLNRRACSEATTYVDALESGTSCIDTKSLRMKWDPLFSSLGISSLEVFEMNLDEIQGMTMSRWVRRVAQPFLLYVMELVPLTLSSFGIVAAFRPRLVAFLTVMTMLGFLVYFDLAMFSYSFWGFPVLYVLGFFL